MKLTIRIKLILAFCLFSLVIIGVLGRLIAWESTKAISQNTANQYFQTAQKIGDLIDRNLFERYGDVQAFGLNSVISNKEAWYQTGEENPIVQCMNQYVDTYDIYYLTLLVDTKGKLIAANTKDDSGNSIDTATLYDVSFSETQWFKKTLAGKFYQSKDGSFTGTHLEDFYTDAHVKNIYKDEGYAIGFSAPVKDADGKVIAIWRNIAKFSIAKEIVTSVYQDLSLLKKICG